jgi:hypothetical protein
VITKYMTLSNQRLLRVSHFEKLIVSLEKVKGEKSETRFNKTRQRVLKVFEEWVYKNKCLKYEKSKATSLLESYI